VIWERARNSRGLFFIDGLAINDTNIFKFVALTIYDEEVWGEEEVMVIDGGARSAGDRKQPVN